MYVLLVKALCYQNGLYTYACIPIINAYLIYTHMYVCMNIRTYSHTHIHTYVFLSPSPSLSPSRALLHTHALAFSPIQSLLLLAQSPARRTTLDCISRVIQSQLHPLAFEVSSNLNYLNFHDAPNSIRSSLERISTRPRGFLGAGFRTTYTPF